MGIVMQNKGIRNNLLAFAVAAFFLFALPATAYADEAKEVLPRYINDGYSVSGDAVFLTSTLADACERINNDFGLSYTITVADNDPQVDETAVINQGKTVTLRSADSNLYTLTFTGIGRHINVLGTLRLENIILSGGIVGNGGVSVSGGELQMSEGSEIRQCFSTFGGGIQATDNSTVEINGGNVSNNRTPSSGSNRGAGIYLWGGSVLTLHSGSINDNEVAGYGAGVFVGLDCRFNMGEEGSIENNTAINDYNEGYGGGVHVWANGLFEMSGGTISGNRAGTAGGGVSAGQGTHAISEPENASRVHIINGNITNNEAGEYGGGLAAFWNGQITMDGGVVSRNSALSGGGVAAYYSAYDDDSVFFEMDGGEISFNRATGSQFGGGGIYVDSFMDSYSVRVEIGNNLAGSESPKIYGNTSALDGGGLAFGKSSVGETDVTINKADIYSNSADNMGGGIALRQGVQFAMHGGTLGGATAESANTATHGGGFSSYQGNNVILFDGDTSIINNIANGDGGGLHIGAEDRASIDALIDGNTAAQNGGGIYVDVAAVLSTLGTTNISRNSANNEGGGIYTEDYVDYANLTSDDYQNLMLEPTTVFSENSASALYLPPTIAASYSNIGYSTSSLFLNGAYANPINNYDINFAAGNPLVNYSIIYDANGGMGSHTDTLYSGSNYTVLDAIEAGISREGYAFLGWNAAADGSGVTYAPGEVIIVNDNLSLYAMWEEVPTPTPPTPTPIPTPVTAKSAKGLAKANDPLTGTNVALATILILAGTGVARARKKLS